MSYEVGIEAAKVAYAKVHGSVNKFGMQAAVEAFLGEVDAWVRIELPPEQIN